MPKQGDDPQSTQQSRRIKTGRHLLSKEQFSVEGIKNDRHRKNNSLQTTADILNRIIETNKVKTKNTARLQHTKQMVFYSQLLQFSAQNNKSKQHQSRNKEAPKYGYIGRYSTLLLQTYRNPCRSPDHHHQSI